MTARDPSTALVIANEGDDDPGHLRDAFRQLGVEWRTCHRQEEELAAAGLAGLGLVVALGSLWSPLDARDNPAIAAELRLLEAALARGVPVLGVCFGGQLLAMAQGAPVFALERPSVGFRPVTLAGGAGSGSPQFFWHHYGFGAPAGATVLSEGPASCWAFETPGALAVQFHPDATPEVLARWTREGRSDLDALGVEPGPILAEAAAHAPRVRESAVELVRRVLGR